MYIVSGKKYTEDPSQKLGSGSEGAIYPFPGNPAQCVKIFHEPESGDRAARDIAAYRAKKIAAIGRMHLTMSPHFAMALEPAYDQNGEVKGFIMPRVKPGCVKILELLKPWRRSNNVTLKDISLLFAKLIGVDLKEIEKNGLSVGDINTGCVMVNSSMGRAWVDTDSWSYPGFPCLATTELYAHPDLYPNLESGKKFVAPKPHHDRFALTVMFSQIALQGAHPFRMGVHPKYSGLRERAKHGVTIFDPGVTYPKALPSPEILSDELLDRIIDILRRKKDDLAFDAALTEFANLLATCKQCGTEYASSRAHCPKCHEKTIVDMTKLAKLLIDTLYKASGTMLHVQVVGKVLRIVIAINDKISIVSIDDGGKMSTISSGLEAMKGSKYRFFGECIAVVRDPYAEVPIPVEIYVLERSGLRQLPNASTGGLENGQALLDTSERFLYRTAGNTLMCGSLFGKDMLAEDRVAQVHQTQTWFTVDHSTGTDREAIFGYDRALRDMGWFVIRGERDASRFSYKEVKFQPMRSGEKLVDFAVYFSKDSVLLARKTSYRGREFARYSVVSLEGKVTKDELVEDGDPGYECWEHLLGKIFQGESVLHVTPKGIVKQTFADGKYSHLEETEGIVTITDQLFRLNGKVGVVRKSGILTVTKKPV
jgi:hypothetical protein